MIEYTFEELLNEKKIEEVRNFLKEGKIGIFPTDTVYGLVSHLYSEKGISKIFEIKKREQEKPLVLFPENIESIEKYVVLNSLSKKAVEKLLPGKVTLILKKKIKIPIGKGDTIGIRLPGEPAIVELIRKLNLPLATTSANISGEPPLLEIKDNKKMEIMKKVDFIINKGKLTNTPSTVLDLVSEFPRILRKGAIPLKCIEKELNTLCKTESLNILFVCTENTCRSPMAEAIAKKFFAETKINTKSCGISAEKGKSISKKTEIVLKKNQLSFSHKTQPLTKNLYEWADIVFVMEKKHRKFIEEKYGSSCKIEMLSKYIEKEEIEDPFGQDINKYIEVFAQIEEAIKTTKELLDKRIN